MYLLQHIAAYEPLMAYLGFGIYNSWEKYGLTIIT